MYRYKTNSQDVIADESTPQLLAALFLCDHRIEKRALVANALTLLTQGKKDCLQRAAATPDDLSSAGIPSTSNLGQPTSAVPNAVTRWRVCEKLELLPHIEPGVATETAMTFVASVRVYTRSNIMQFSVRKHQSDARRNAWTLTAMSTFVL